jgi:NTE family protein
MNKTARSSASLLVGVMFLAIGVRVRGEGQPDRRPRIGVAFGGGSARGLAHVGVIRWFEEHRIPIDLVAGTSMGGLVGGAFASGLTSPELTRMLAATDWDEMFGSSAFRYKNVRRKLDARAYPSRIEFGVKHGIAPPVALNNGQQVDFFLSKVTAPYAPLRSFDDLPTPFRCVAVDLLTAQAVVLDRGSLARAMRATMSLPGVFPPIELDGRVLVDGGAFNNVPADVVRAMGADTVIAINVGDMSEKRAVSSSLFGLMSGTVDAMMLANTRVALKSADIVVNPDLEGFTSLDWRRHAELADAGYRAAEAMRDKLLPLAVSDSAWAAYLAEREARRRTALPAPQFISIVGAVSADRRRMEEVLKPRVGQPLDVDALENSLETLGGLDRYETVDWQLVEEGGQPGLEIRAREKSSAPPFLMLGVSLENTTTDSFSFQLAARYLAFDVLGSGSELRIDGAAGAQPQVGIELYRPLGRSPLFVTLSAYTVRRTINFITDDVVVAQYEETHAGVGAGAGVNLGRDDEVRLGFTTGRLDASVRAGDPELPDIGGGETRAMLRWLHDGQDSPVVPSSGLRAVATLGHIFSSPALPSTFVTDRSNTGLTQAEFRASSFWPSRQRRDRVFVAGGGGTSFDGSPLRTEQFQLGQPLRLGAYDLGELRGDHYGVLSAGYLRGVGRLPDFLGGPIFIGGWLEGGSAFDRIDEARFRTSMSAAAILDTLVGPTILGASFSAEGTWRYYLGIGRLF